MYPGVTDRVKAALVDGFLLILLMYLVTSVFSSLGNVPTAPRVIAFVVILFLYDPLLTSFSAGTLGHKAVGIRVKRLADEQRNISFPAALLRFLLKVLLGWISLITVSTSEQRLAIHDRAVKSIVVYNWSMAETGIVSSEG
ncbi:RDD family protein [Lewinella sp. W8]|uniref:RDD family protein n=1 Tax=Lewinella sp. W8 TaxID=2528208 RepID=UPI001067E1FB|nr:RDD family protein [Lewinella sp. W8]MTB51170.1 RDD family protein [Lewinella sp. W8]